MPSLETALQQKVDAETAERERAEKSEEQSKRAKEFEEFARLERLMLNHDVQWLLGEFESIVTREHDMALNDMAVPVEADKARHRHKTAKDMRNLLPSRHAQMKNRLFTEEKPLT